MTRVHSGFVGLVSIFFFPPPFSRILLATRTSGTLPGIARKEKGEKKGGEVEEGMMRRRNTKGRRKEGGAKEKLKKWRVLVQKNTQNLHVAQVFLKSRTQLQRNAFLPPDSQKM